MKLNLRIIMESLISPYEYVSGKPDCAMSLKGIYPLVNNRDSNDSDMLYLASWEQLKPLDEYPENLICIGGGLDARALFDEYGITGLIYEEGNNAFAILREVGEVFTKYNCLERNLLDALIEKASTRSILNTCAEFLECHVTLYGMDFSLLEYSDRFLPPEDDVVWKKTMSAKRSAIPMVPREKVKMLPNKPKDSPRSTYLDIGGGVPPHVNIAFDYGDSRIATLIFCQSAKPITEHHQWLVDSIADIMHPIIMERYNTILDKRNYFRTSVVTALCSKNTDSLFLLANLKRYGWHANDEYQILLVVLPPENTEISHYLYNYENIFANAYSDIIALWHDDLIFILLRNEACSILKQCIPSLTKQLEMDDGICSIGHMFCDFIQLKSQYELAKLPLQLSSKSNSRLRYYGDIMETHIITELSACVPLLAICHHAAVRIHEYDITHGTSFMLTLETYLLNNRSLMTASEKLFIHRSTLTYRLKCIKKIVPMQLEDPQQRLHILLSCITLRILNSIGTGSAIPGTSINTP